MSTRLHTLERVEGWVDPLADDERAEAAAFAEFCDRVLPDGHGMGLEAAGTFPDAELRAFAGEGFIRALVPEDQGGRLDWARAMRLATRLAAHDLDVTLCFGGTVLASIPVLVAGTPAQRARFFADVLAGEMGGLALSEWEHGSDLLAGVCRARPVDDAGADTSEGSATGFILDGEKGPTNNGSIAANLVVLARTREGGEPDASSHSLFFVPRGTPGLGPRARFASLGYRSMDLSGAVFTGARLGRDALIGAPGEGFLVTRRSLEISRSGVAMMAVGAHGAALAFALAHAKNRRLYGAPIAELGGVRKLIARIGARLVLAVALGRRTARSIAAYGTRARGLSSAAKLLCPELLERSVHDAGTLLGARSLMSDLPFGALRRSAPVLAIFDGSSQLQLDELWRHAAMWDDARGDIAADRRAIWDERARPFTVEAEDNGLLARLSPPAVLADAGVPAPLADAARAVTRAARAGRGRPQEARFRASEAAGWIAGLAALAEALGEARARGRTHDAQLLDACLGVALAEGAPIVGARLVELGQAFDDPSLAASAPALLSLAAASVSSETLVADALLA